MLRSSRGAVAKVTTQDSADFIHFSFKWPVDPCSGEEEEGGRFQGVAVGYCYRGMVWMAAQPAECRRLWTRKASPRSCSVCLSPNFFEMPELLSGISAGGTFLITPLCALHNCISCFPTAVTWCGALDLPALFPKTTGPTSSSETEPGLCSPVLRDRAPCGISLTPWHARTPTVSIAVCVPVWVTTRIPPGGFQHWCHCPSLLRLSLAETRMFRGGKTVRSERWGRTRFHPNVLVWLFHTVFMPQNEIIRSHLCLTNILGFFSPYRPQPPSPPPTSPPSPAPLFSAQLLLPSPACIITPAGYQLIITFHWRSGRSWFRRSFQALANLPLLTKLMTTNEDNNVHTHIHTLKEQQNTQHKPSLQLLPFLLAPSPGFPSTFGNPNRTDPVLVVQCVSL